MTLRNLPITALLTGAVFVYSPFSFAQAPIVDSSIDRNQAASSQPQAQPQTSPADNPLNQGELFYQLQLLQQEVMQLRGVVEEQNHQLQKLKQQNTERYIDLDRRIGELAKQPAATAKTGATNVSKPIANTKTVAMAGEREAYNAAYSKVVSKQFDVALDTFKQFLVDFPDGKYAPNSYYWLGELYQVISPKDLDASRESFSQLLSLYPNHAKAPDAMYKLGKVYFDLGDPATAQKWLQEVISKYGSGARSSSAADKARAFLQDNF